ncbi:MAG TPA: hypothetical protein PK317_03845 [Coprothermobacter proteolyticus]|nr:hypothetical protein [Coprothermobacter proteolyticus]
MTPEEELLSEVYQILQPYKQYQGEPVTDILTRVLNKFDELLASILNEDD